MGGGVPGRSNFAWNFQLGDTDAGVGIWVQASLLYQGAAQFEIAGVLQVNAVIPTGLSPSDAAPLVLTIGNASSQTATIAIH